jgi:2-amino-4-hydroxy-6-hydroxymethyldihydropteridine diphosphokinase
VDFQTRGIILSVSNAAECDPLSTIAYLSLGSNVGDARANLEHAIARLDSFGERLAVSSFYETEPVELIEQPWFLNCAVKLKTALSPEELLQAALTIEQEMGRYRIQKNGPRIIDIDIVLFGEMVMDTPTLTIPHPAMRARRFVLAPLAEIDGELRHPVINRTMRELLDLLPPGQEVRKITA